MNIQPDTAATGDAHAVATSMVRASTGAVVEVSPIWRCDSVLAFTGIKGRASLYELIAAGAFPRGVSITGGRAVGWPSHQVMAWVADRQAGVPLPRIDRTSLRSNLRGKIGTGAA